MAEPIKISLEVQGAKEAAAAVQKVGDVATATAEAAGQASAVMEQPALMTALEKIGQLAAGAIDGIGKAAEAIEKTIEHVAVAIEAPIAEMERAIAREEAVVRQVAAVDREAEQRRAAAIAERRAQIQQQRSAEMAALPGSRMSQADILRGMQEPVVLAPPVIKALPGPGTLLPGITGAEAGAAAAIADATKAIEQQAEAAHKAGRSLGDLFRGVFDLVGVQMPFASGLGRTAIAAEGLVSSASVASATVGILAVAATAAVAAIGALAAGIYSAATGAAHFNDEAGKQADAIGVDVERWTRLRFAGELSNVSAGQLGNTLSRLSVEAAKGSKALEAIGVSTKRNDGTTKDSIELFTDAVDALSQYEDGIDKTRLAQELFGVSSKKLMTLINGGSAELRRLGDEAESRGVVVTRQMAEEADRLNNAMTRVSQSLHAIWNQLGSRLVPIIADATELIAGLTRNSRMMGFAFDTALMPVQSLSKHLAFVVLTTDMAIGALEKLTGKLFSVRSGDGSFVGPEGSLESDSSPSTTPATTATPARKSAPHLPTTAELAAAKEQREIELIHEKGEIALDEIATRHQEIRLEARYRDEKISAERVAVERKQIVESEFASRIRELQAARANADPEHQGKAQAEFEEGEKAAIEKRNQELGDIEERRVREVREREEKIKQIRVRAEQQVSEITLRGRRATVEDDYRENRIGIEQYFERKKKLIDDDYDQEIRNTRNVAEAEKNPQKADEMFEAGQLVAIRKRGEALADLGRQRERELEKLAEGMRKFEAEEAKWLEQQKQDLREIAQLRAQDAAQEIQHRIGLVQTDPTKSDREKRQEETGLLQQRLGGISEERTEINGTLNDAKTGVEKEKSQQRLNGLLREEQQINQRIASMRPPTFTKSLSIAFDNLIDKWGRFSQNLTDAIAGPISNAMNNLGDNVLDIASGMKTAGEVGLNMARQLASGVITAIGQMLVAKTAAFLTGQSQKATDAATTTANLPTKAADAAATAGGSWGLSAVIGLAAFAALMAAALAFEEGGEIPGGEKLIRVNEGGRRETVINAAGTDRFRGMLSAINAGARTAMDLAPHLAVPDRSAIVENQFVRASIMGRAAGQAMPPINVPDPQVRVIIARTDREYVKIMQSLAGQRVIASNIDRNRGRQGFERL